MLQDVRHLGLRRSKLLCQEITNCKPLPRVAVVLSERPADVVWSTRECRFYVAALMGIGHFAITALRRIPGTYVPRCVAWTDRNGGRHPMMSKRMRQSVHEGIKPAASTE